MHVSAYSETISDDYFETNFDRQQSRFYNVFGRIPAILGQFSDGNHRRAIHSEPTTGDQTCISEPWLERIG